jgi:hypothetical protein
MRYEYIYDKKRNFYYVPRMPSMCAARERDSLFMKFLGESPLIVGPRDWELLLRENKIKHLEV